MLDHGLSKQELTELLVAHRRALNVREAYRINAVTLLGNGRTGTDVPDSLLIDPETVRNCLKPCLGHVYKKPKLVPRKADASKFLKDYEKRRQTAPNARCSCSWVPRTGSKIR